MLTDITNTVTKFEPSAIGKPKPTTGRELTQQPVKASADPFLFSVQTPFLQNANDAPGHILNVRMQRGSSAHYGTMFRLSATVAPHMPGLCIAAKVLS